MGEEGEKKKERIVGKKVEKRKKREANNYNWFRPFLGLCKPEMSSMIKQ